MKLYELTGEYLKVQEMLENEDFNKETIENTLDCIDFEIDVKAENYGKMIKNYETEMLGIKGQKEALKDALQDEIDRLDKKQKNY